MTRNICVYQSIIFLNKIIKNKYFDNYLFLLNKTEIYFKKKKNVIYENFF